MADTNLPTLEVLRQLLRYEPETGKLFWRERHQSMFKCSVGCDLWNARRAGKEAGTENGGRIYVTINTRRLLAHRIVWVLEHGVWPDGEIDHINHNPLDNRIGNLRVVTRAENRKNLPRPRTNTSGVMGVYFDKSRGRWAAYINYGGKPRNLGRYDTLSEAAAARLAAERKYGYHKNHGK